MVVCDGELATRHPVRASWRCFRFPSTEYACSGGTTAKGFMSDFFDHIAKLYDALRGRRGEFSLFALLMPADGDERWDLVLSAPWLGVGLEDYDAVFQAMRQTLSPGDLSLISRIVIMRPSDEAVRELLNKPRAAVPFGAFNFHFGGTGIKRAHVIGFNPKSTRRRAASRTRARSAAKVKEKASAGR